MRSNFIPFAERWLPWTSTLALCGLLCACQTSTDLSLSGSASAHANNFASDGVMAVLWFQKAAEYKALCFQAYNIATERLHAATATNRTAHLAVVMDIDETVLDNSPFQGGLAFHDEDYAPTTWQRWAEAVQAQAVPAATNFVAEAARLGVEVFYISNRKTSELPVTLENLRKENFAFVDPAHVLLKGESKEIRRNSLTNNFQIILLVGDNLNDFIDLEKKSPELRDQRTTALRDLWGSRFIILPNPMYGDWENALYDYSSTLSPAKKAAIRRRNLRTYP